MHTYAHTHIHAHTHAYTHRTNRCTYTQTKQTHTHTHETHTHTHNHTKHTHACAYTHRHTRTHETQTHKCERSEFSLGCGWSREGKAPRTLLRITARCVWLWMCGALLWKAVDFEDHVQEWRLPAHQHHNMSVCVDVWISAWAAAQFDVRAEGGLSISV